MFQQPDGGIDLVVRQAAYHSFVRLVRIQRIVSAGVDVPVAIAIILPEDVSHARDRICLFSRVGTDGDFLAEAEFEVIPMGVVVESESVDVAVSVTVVLPGYYDVVEDASPTYTRVGLVPVGSADCVLGFLVEVVAIYVPVAVSVVLPDDEWPGGEKTGRSLRGQAQKVEMRRLG